MGLFSNAVKLVRRKQNSNEDNIIKDVQELDFSLRNYAKESFSVLIQKPLSACVLKMMRFGTMIITGAISGIILACIACVIFLQFGSMENTFISGLIADRFDKLFPDSELTIKSANFFWNSESKSFDIGMKRVRVNDMFIPHVTIQPDYLASLKQQTIVAKNISITNPKIAIDISDNLQNALFNPNLEKGDINRTLFQPISYVREFRTMLNDDVNIKLINADITLLANGNKINFKNAYIEQKLDQFFPKQISGKFSLTGQKYLSGFSLNTNDGRVYKLEIDSVNPDTILNILAKTNISIDPRITNAIGGYNLPVTGHIDMTFDNGKLLTGNFDLSGINGSIRLPVKSSLSLNLGKRIDNGEISGSFSPKMANIDSIKVSYGKSGLQLTGIKVPLYDYNFMNTANLDGTLSLTNIDVDEMESLLPENLTKSAIMTLKSCLPGFKLELFKIDLKGPIAFSDTQTNTISAGQGSFKINEAKIPVGDRMITHVNATGFVTNDGLDIKMSNAKFENIKINNGIFYVSNKDHSWIGKVNIDMPVSDISSYTKSISNKLASLPLDKLGIKGVANLDVKVVSLADTQNQELPFKVVQGDGVLSSDFNTKQLRLTWDQKGMSVTGNINADTSKIELQLIEDFIKDSGHSTMKFLAESEFLKAIVPGIHDICGGDYILTIDTNWKNGKEESIISMNLKNATLRTPFVGNMKLPHSDGHFTAYVTKNGDEYDFANMKFESEKNKFSGSMSVDKNGNMIRCNLDNFNVNDSVAKIQMLHKDEKHIFFSAIGDSLNIEWLKSAANNSDVLTSAYINLQKLAVTNHHTLKNVKGTLELQNGKIVGGACFGILGEDTTLALTAKAIENTNDSLITLSASNAGEFLKYFKITDAIHGGNVNIVLKNPRGLEQSLEGGFEISNFIMRDSPSLTKLVSLSSVNWLPGADNISVGFNSCKGSFIFAGKSISIAKGIALSPSIAISFSGDYDRENDNLNFSGVSLPMSSYLNAQAAQMDTGTLIANFGITGALVNPVLSVKPLEYTSNDQIAELFGNSLPLIGVRRLDSDVSPIGVQKNPFDDMAFDQKAGGNILEKRAKQQPEQTTRKEHGVTIRRGIKRKR